MTREKGGENAKEWRRTDGVVAVRDVHAADMHVGRVDIEAVGVDPAGVRAECHVEDAVARAAEVYTFKQQSCFIWRLSEPRGGWGVW